MKNEAYIRNRLLNKTLHKNEVACAILHDPSIDCINKEVPKTRETITVLLKLFKRVLKQENSPLIFEESTYIPHFPRIHIPTTMELVCYRWLQIFKLLWRKIDFLLIVRRIDNIPAMRWPWLNNKYFPVVEPLD